MFCSAFAWAAVLRHFSGVKATIADQAGNCQAADRGLWLIVLVDILLQQRADACLQGETDESVADSESR